MHSYPDNFEAISEKFEAQGFESLSPAEQVAYCIWWLEGEVNNGGFDQFFLNSAGGFYSETCAALTTIGAHKTRELLEAACAVSFPGAPPRDHKQRNAIQASGDEVDKRLNALDQKFFAYEDDLELMVNKFLAAHGT